MIQEEIFYFPEFKSMEYETAAGGPQVLTKEGITQRTKVDPTTQVKTLTGPTLILAPIRADSKARCNVVLRYSLKMREDYSDVTNFGGATLGATIELDDMPEDFVFTSGGDDKMRHALGSSIWHFDRPFINGQHVRVWWFRKGYARIPKASASQTSEPPQ
jgi:hypothetical protein